jgi:atypical dual specificity phosphatase
MSDRNFGWVIMNKLAGVRGPTSNDDLQFLKDEGISILVRLAEKHKAHVTTEQVAKFGIEDLHFPVPDFTPPSEIQIEQITQLVKERLTAGQKVAVSCGAGIGRTGTILTCILISMCNPVGEAFKIMKNAGREAFETPDQHRAILRFAQKLGKC